MATSASPWEKYKPASAPAETASAAQEPASAAVAPPSSADQATAKNDAEFAAGNEKLKEDYKAKTTKTGMSPVKVGDFETEIPSFFLTAPGVVTAGAALYGAGVGAKKGYDVAVSGGKKLYGSLRDMMGAKKEDGLLASQQADKAALAQSTPADVSAQTKPTTAFDTSTDIGKPFSKTDTNLVEKGEINTGTNTVSKDVTANKKDMAKGIAEGLPEPDLRTGTGKEAWAGQAEDGKFKSEYSSIKEVPKGYVFVKDAQYADVIRGNVGQPTYTKEMAVRPFPTTYKGTPESAVGVSNEINRSLNRPTRDELKAAKAEMSKNTPGIFKEISRSKLVRVAGAGGALVAFTDLALAGQKAKEGQYEEAARLGIPAATGLISPAIGGLTGAGADPSAFAQQLRAVAPMMGSFAEIANQKVQQILKKKKPLEQTNNNIGVPPPSMR